MKLSEIFEAKLSKWEVSVETGPHQFVTITVNAADKADAEKKAMAEAKRRRLNSPMLGQAKQVAEGIFGQKIYVVSSIRGETDAANKKEAEELRDKLLKAGVYAVVKTRVPEKPSKSKPSVTEGKMRKESASDIFYRYEKLKKSFVNPTPEQKKMLDNVLAMATAAMDEQFKKTQSNLEAKFAGSDWWEEVKKMYKVKEEGNKWVVISNARDWKQTKDWEFDTKYEALEQLEKLVKYKAADRKAGKGDVEKDFERVDALRKREQA